MRKHIIISLLLFLQISVLAQVQYGGIVSAPVTGQSAQTATVNNIIPATSASTGTLTVNYAFGSVQVISTGSGGTFIFESANSDANYVTMPVWNNVTMTGTPIQAAINATSSSIIYYFPITTNYIRLRIASTITGGSIQALTKLTSNPVWPTSVTVSQATGANLNVAIASGTVTTVSTLSNTTQLTPGVAAANLGKAEDAVAASGDTGIGTLYLRNDALTTNAGNGDYQMPVTDTYGATIVKQQQLHKRTYSCAFTVVPASAATDIFQIIGSATTTVEITRITIGGSAGSAAQVPVLLSKRSSANSGGTSTASTMVPHNSADAAATAVGAIYTANPTPGTAVGNIGYYTVPIGTLTSTPSTEKDILIGTNSKPIILNGVAQALTINLNATTLTTGLITVTVTFTEY